VNSDRGAQPRPDHQARGRLRNDDITETLQTIEGNRLDFF
jgi:hypothetical protein